jgi:hypothetical protein
MCSSRKMTSVISGLLGASIYLFKRLYDLEQSRGDCAFPFKVFFFFFLLCLLSPPNLEIFQKHIVLFTSLAMSPYYKNFKVKSL